MDKIDLKKKTKNEEIACVHVSKKNPIIEMSILTPGCPAGVQVCFLVKWKNEFMDKEVSESESKVY